jgi:hypothetical protein
MLSKDRVGEIMNRKLMLLMLISLVSIPAVRIEARPPLMVDDGTSSGIDDLFSFESLMKADDLPISAPKTDKQSGLKVLCQYIGLMIFMKIVDFTNWCQRSCKTFFEHVSHYTLPRHES